MPVNLRPQSESGQIWVEDEEYQRLVKRAEGGWSRCTDEVEWLAKLHYLREGFRAGKMSREDFTERETRLVTGWIRPGG